VSRNKKVDQAIMQDIPDDRSINTDVLAKSHKNTETMHLLYACAWHNNK